jgi:hypothetical protein
MNVAIFAAMIQASLQVCIVVTPHSTDIKTIVGENMCPGS